MEMALMIFRRLVSRPLYLTLRPMPYLGATLRFRFPRECKKPDVVKHLSIKEFSSDVPQCPQSFKFKDTVRSDGDCVADERVLST